MVSNMNTQDKVLTVTQKRKSGLWCSVRNLLLLQVKLWIDAIRDFALMPVAVVCFFLDRVSHNKGNKNWEHLMTWGRQSDRHINLFQHNTFEQENVVTVDDVADIVEDVLKSNTKTTQSSQQLVDTVKQRIKARFGQKP